jgi:3-phenylpropionate/trans-cinnamate dioxygenase ferredoxin component
MMNDEARELIRICSVADVPEGSAKAFRVNGELIAVYHSAGKFFATEDICSHEHEHLSDGWLEGDKIECPRHGAQFSLITGEALSLPATEPIQVFEVKVEGEDVLIALS